MSESEQAYIDKIKEEYVLIRLKKVRTKKENETMNLYFQRLVLEDQVPNGSHSVKKDKTRLLGNPFMS